MTNSPVNDLRISVVLPTFNRAHFLKEAVGGVLNQTAPVFEVVIVDDGSTDDTRAVVEQLPGPIRYIRQENQGPAAARNRGMVEARGNWIALLDSDDLWYKDKIRLQSDFLARNPETDFVFSDLTLVTPDTDNDEPEILDREAHQYLVSNAGQLDRILEYLFRINFVPTSSSLFRKASLEQVGYMDESLRICEDYDFLLKFACHCRFGFVNRVLVKRRMHGANIMGPATYAPFWETTLRVLTKLHLEADAPEAVKRARLASISAVHHRLGGYYFKRRDYASADTHFRAVMGSGILPKGVEALKFYVKLLLTMGSRKFQN